MKREAMYTLKFRKKGEVLTTTMPGYSMPACLRYSTPDLLGVDLTKLKVIITRDKRGQYIQEKVEQIKKEIPDAVIIWSYSWRNGEDQGVVLPKSFDLGKVVFFETSEQKEAKEKARDQEKCDELMARYKNLSIVVNKKDLVFFVDMVGEYLVTPKYQTMTCRPITCNNEEEIAEASKQLAKVTECAGSVQIADFADVTTKMDFWATQSPEVSEEEFLPEHYNLHLVWYGHSYEVVESVPSEIEHCYITSPPLKKDSQGVYYQAGIGAYKWYLKAENVKVIEFSEGYKVTEGFALLAMRESKEKAIEIAEKIKKIIKGANN